MRSYVLPPSVLRSIAATMLLMFFTTPVLADKSVLKNFSDRDSSAGQKQQEPHQRAMVAWNGSEERLVLSTDLMQIPAGRRIEFLPLPAAPRDVHKTSLELFIRLAAIAGAKGADLSALTAFSASGEMADHLDIKELPTVVAFNSYARSRIGDEADPAIAQMVGSYIDRGYRNFVYDEVMVGETVQTFPPVVQQFSSPHLYYPLQDSSVSQSGTTQVDLVLITPRPVHLADIGRPIQVLSSFFVTPKELGAIDPSVNWAEFMKGTSIVVQHIQITGELHQLTKDLIADFQETNL